MRCVFPIESRDKCPSSSLQHGEARERNAVAVAHREGPPGHRCHCAELTSPHFRDCARPTVCRRGGRIRMRPLRRQTASAIPSGAPASPDARQPRGQRHRRRRLLQQLQQHKVTGRRPPAELPSHPAPSPPCLRASVEGAQNLTKTGTGHAPLGSRARDCNNSEHTRSRLSS